MVTVHPTASVASSAVIEGDVRIGAGSRVLHGAVLVGNGGTIEIGASVIVMEQAVLRASARFDLRVGDHCLIGPHASISGATIGSEVFVATGASIFPGADLGDGSEVRINAVVQVKTRLEPGATVPIGWVAVGNPAQILPPGDHDAIWTAQQPLDFPGFVFGVDRSAGHPMVQLTERYSRSLAAGDSSAGDGAADGTAGWES